MKDKKLRVVFITMDEPYYIPRYIENVIHRLDSSIEVVKVYATPATLSKKSFLHTVHDYYSYFGALVFSYMVILRFLYFLSDLINKYLHISRNFHSVDLVCRKFCIAYARIQNINSEKFISELVRLKLDIVFSLSCPQIFGNELLSVPSRGSLNIHSSLLPDYRGLNANFWVLAKGEKITGVTIHYINPGIDDGDILIQEKIEIDNSWSLNDLYFKAIDTGSRMISRCLKLIQENKSVRHKNDISKGSYFSFPTGKDVKEFRARKKRFFKFY